MNLFKSQWQLAIWRIDNDSDVDNVGFMWVRVGAPERTTLIDSKTGRRYERLCYEGNGRNPHGRVMPIASEIELLDEFAEDVEMFRDFLDWDRRRKDRDRVLAMRKESNHVH